MVLLTPLLTIFQLYRGVQFYNILKQPHKAVVFIKRDLPRENWFKLIRNTTKLSYDGQNI